MLAKESLESFETANGLKSPSALWRKSDKYQTLDIDPLLVFPPCLMPHCHQQSLQKESSPSPRGGVVLPQPHTVVIGEKILALDCTSTTIRGYALEVGEGDRDGGDHAIIYFSLGHWEEISALPFTYFNTHKSLTNLPLYNSSLW